MKAIKYMHLILLFSCTNSISQNNSTGYLVKNIESKNSWYIIYAEKNDSIYKIVVGKNEDNVDKDLKKIVIGQYYDFKLQSRRDSAPEIGGVKLNPINRLDVECYSYDKKTEICIEPKKGIYDLYYTKDLKGLYYKKVR